MTRKILTSLICLLLATGIAEAAKVTFNGCRNTPFAETVNASTGLDGLYVIDGLDGVSLTVTDLAASRPVTWKKWGYRGAAYAEDIDPSLYSGNASSTTLSRLDPNCGYAIDYGTDTYYIWIIDYSTHRFTVNSLSQADEQDCSTATLNFDGSADKITYYSINARSMELDRDILLSYTSQTADEEQMLFVTGITEKHLPYINTAIYADAPLCATSFTLEGDKYLRSWNEAVSYTTPTYRANRVEVISSVEQVSREVENEIKIEGSTLGGSAPVEIAFHGAVSEAAAYREWQMSRDSEFYEIIYRNQDLDFTYTFTEMGTLYVRLLAANDAGTCEAQNDPYTVNISESAIRCPNAFSPDASEGVNDEWRVSYKSIISFECYIFDRWGTKMAEFHDPSQGWDGKYRGKYVPAGVYYYVIKARGSDGKDYNLSGDINILKSKRK